MPSTHPSPNPCQRNIRYSAAAEERGVGDVFLPDQFSARAPILLIHGGGWNALAKESLEPVAGLFLADRRAVFSINYRLLDHAPWPACGDDCIAAAQHLLDGGLAEHGLPAPRRLLICGASAGGHLAMMTGLRLPSDRVEAIISLSGPSRLDLLDDASDPWFRSAHFLRKFFGTSGDPSADQIAAASPALIVRPGAPPLFCIHSTNDRLVSIRHAEEAVAAWKRAGAPATLLPFDGAGDKHGLWDSDDLANRRVVVPADELIREVLRRLDVGSAGVSPSQAGETP